MVTLRRAASVPDGDASAAADVWLSSFAAALPTVVSPRSADEVRGYFRDVVVPLRETWVADAGADGGIVGVMVLHDDEPLPALSAARLAWARHR